ncbi:MAG TPA: radical SAM protein [Candidatus Nanopelagicales bacterium]
MGTARVALVTLGCARNEVDSEELAGRLAAGGFQLVDDAQVADAVVVNTCGFIDAAKRESIDVLMDAGGRTPSGAHRAVVAVGCMAERYGEQLAAELPEADAVLGFDAYPDIAARLAAIVAGERPASHAPRDRRSLLPLTPVARQGAAGGHVPGHGPAGSHPLALGEATEVGVATLPRPGAAALHVEGHPWIRRRISSGPVASLKIASGCDRRCAFCAIPSFRGAFVSRPAADVVAEAAWLADQGVRELVLVSENSTSYGKDLADPRALERLLESLAVVDSIDRIRVSYLQPAELRPDLVATMLDLPVVADHFDLSFQHASPTLLRRMRRFGGSDAFLELIGRIRARSPRAGIRSNVIVGFPGEQPSDLEELRAFLAAAELDAVGVFGYSDEEGTEAAGLDGHLDEAEIRARVDDVAALVDEVMAQRAERRVGQAVEVLVEAVDGLVAEGRAEHQGPEDGSTSVRLPPELRGGVVPGAMLRARVVSSEGVDLHAVEVSVVRR